MAETVFTVTSKRYKGPGTIHEAVQNARGVPEAVIEFAPGLAGRSIELKGPLLIRADHDLRINGDIDGDGAPDITFTGLGLGDGVNSPFNGNGHFKVYADARLTLEALVLADGRPEPFQSGYPPIGLSSSIDNAGDLTIIGSVIRDNIAQTYGGSSGRSPLAATVVNRADGKMTIRDTLFEGNQAFAADADDGTINGGDAASGIINLGALSLERVAISGQAFAGEADEGGTPGMSAIGVINRGVIAPGLVVASVVSPEVPDRAEGQSGRAFFIDFADDPSPVRPGLAGTTGGDRLDATVAGSAYLGFGGDDTLVARGGDDSLYGGTGDDRIDVRAAVGSPVYDGGAGGADTLDYSRAGVSEGVMVRLGSGKAIADGGAYRAAISGFERVIGGDGADSVSGGEAGEFASGRRGDDYLSGAGGDDTLYGRRGADHLGGGEGDDMLFGGGGADYLPGDAGADSLFGGAQGDALSGGDGDDSLFGGEGRDYLTGGDGADAIFGGAHHDDLFAGAGDDSLFGGKGDDGLTGGAGRDVFHFARREGRDEINDFTPGEDLVAIRGGPGGFGGLKIADVGPDVVIRFANTVIVIDGLSVGELSASDFLFE